MWYQLPVHIALALIWTALWESFSARTLLTGFVVGGGVLHLFSQARGQTFYLKRIIALGRLVVLVIWHLVKANFVIASLCLAPKPKFRPGIVALPLRVKSEAAITAVVHYVTVTPGSIPLEVAEDKSEFYIHCIDLDDLESVLRAKDIFEDLLLEVGG